MVGVLCCREAAVHLNLGIPPRLKDNHKKKRYVKILKKTSKNWQQNWVWVIALSSNVINTHIAPGEELPLDDQSEQKPPDLNPTGNL